MKKLIYFFILIYMFSCSHQKIHKIVKHNYLNKYLLPSSNKVCKAKLTVIQPSAKEVQIEVYKNNNQILTKIIKISKEGYTLGSLRGFTWKKDNSKLALCFSRDTWKFNKIIIIYILRKAYKIVDNENEKIPEWTKMKFWNYNPQFPDVPSMVDTSTWGEQKSYPYKIDN